MLNHLQSISTGRTAGGNYNQVGGGVNYQCMPSTPEYNSDEAVNNGAYLANVEYESHAFGVFEDAAHDQNAPCAVCNTETRPTLMTIPAMRTCPDGWTKEYEGRYHLTLAFS